MNPIKNIEIKNFKSIRHVKIDDCRRINVFIGYPNVGKSNILEALGLFSILQLTNRENFKFDDICRVKHLSELFFNQDYREKPSIQLNENSRLQLRIQNRNQLELEFEEKSNTDQVIVKVKIVEQHDMLVKDPPQTPAFIYPPKKDTPLSFVVKKYSFLNDAPVNNSGPLPLSIPYGNNLLEVLQREPELRKDLAEILKTYGLKVLLDTSSGTIMLIKDLDDSSVLRIPYHQIADTLKRLVFYKAAVQTNSESILLFEEPEAHMFPPYIRKFTSDVIFDKTNQFFIATHSPYVLDTFMEEVPEDLSIYLVYYEGGETKIKRMSEKDMDEVNEYGVDLFYNLESYLKHGQVNNA